MEEDTLEGVDTKEDILEGVDTKEDTLVDTLVDTLEAVHIKKLLILIIDKHPIIRDLSIIQLTFTLLLHQL